MCCVFIGVMHVLLIVHTSVVPYIHMSSCACGGHSFYLALLFDHFYLTL